MATIKLMRILLNNCIEEGTIPDRWQNTQIILLHTKNDKLQIDNYRSISLLSYPYKLLAKIIPNRLENKFDDYEPPE